MKFIDIPEGSQRQAINTVALQTGLPPSSIEKDWWVTQVLEALHTLPYAEHIAFKGGTSLSKCWNLIDRFSEDVDIALNREFLGFSGELSKTQISDRLRRAACSFVREKTQYDVKNALLELGIRANAFSIEVLITPVTTTDPEVITITYHSLYEVAPYIKNTVKIEISGRSMVEPIEKKAISAAIDAHFPKAPFAEQPFEVNAVIPERTFLEKVFLLHEEFKKEVVRVERMSRHIYDLAMMMNSKEQIADRAIHDEALYRAVLEHRRKFIGLKGFNYDDLYSNTLCIVPNEDIAKLRNGYQTEIDAAIRRAEIAERKAAEKDAVIERLKNRIDELDRKANPQRYRLSSGAELIGYRFLSNNPSTVTLKIRTKVKVIELTAITYFSDNDKRLKAFSNGELTEHEFVNDCFSAAEQVSETQANFLGTGFELITGGTAQPHVGIGGGGSTSDLPWRDKDKNLKKRTAIKRH